MNRRSFLAWSGLATPLSIAAARLGIAAAPVERAIEEPVDQMITVTARDGGFFALPTMQSVPTSIEVFGRLNGQANSLFQKIPINDYMFIGSVKNGFQIGIYGGDLYDALRVVFH
jgi:hypothetical protein